MTSPSTFLTSDAHREAVIADLSTFVDNTAGEQGGVSGTVIKGALSAAKKVDSNIVNKAVARLLPDLAEALDPYWATFKEGGHGDSFEAYLQENSSALSNSVLETADKQAEKAPAALAKVYSPIRGKIASVVEANIAKVGPIVEKYAG